MIRKLLNAIRRNEKYLLVFSFLYILGISIYMLLHRAWFSPDQFFVFALLASFIAGRFRLFIFDWSPFVLFFLGYEILRGIVPYIIHGVHIQDMIIIDKFIFGFVPTIKFQSLLYNPGNLQWYDYIAVLFYISHFIIPMMIGYYFWIKDRGFFKQYSLTFLILSYSAFFTFIIFPAMPPWMAASQGYIPQVKEVTSVVVSRFLPSQINFPTIYSFIAADPVAAVPSLHAAFPFLIFLFAIKRFKKIGFVFTPYVLGVWFAVIYLGEHYFADVLIGAVYALFSFIAVEKKEFLIGKAKSFYFKYLSKKEMDLDIAEAKD